MATEQPDVSTTSPNPAGVDDLGIDISGVKLTPASVQGFLASLSPEVRHDVQAACAMYDHTPAGAGEQTLAFCADASKA
jgi:hypothetical protein